MKLVTHKENFSSRGRFQPWVCRFMWAATRKLLAWSLIFLVWLGSLLAVTASASAMDALSSLIPRWLPETQHTKQKRAIAEQKREVRKAGKRTRSFGKKMIQRNIADASTSVVPIVGGAASVGFAVADVKAACDLMEWQATLEEFFKLEQTKEPESSFESFCNDAKATVTELSATADQALLNLRGKLENVKNQAKKTHDVLVTSATETLEILFPLSTTDDNEFCDINPSWLYRVCPVQFCDQTCAPQQRPQISNTGAQDSPPLPSQSAFETVVDWTADAMCYWSGNC